MSNVSSTGGGGSWLQLGDRFQTTIGQNETVTVPTGEEWIVVVHQTKGISVNGSRAESGALVTVTSGDTISGNSGNFNGSPGFISGVKISV